ncbi:DNA repair protein complementing XP-C cells homolog [Anopheles maculipalpis]|uniref:DNA repair protein complementing XP-C cells homolog n=1 Tax=Anopheles maculipalpis TaxID=1496333 RepID=UPI002158A915|nr:DNA repair protein complementing XP-C cells homolog [Anopheles maculipalpis]
MSDEDDFQSASEEEADFSASEDEWLPTKDSKKKAGKKSKATASSSDEEDDDEEDGDEDGSTEDSDDLEDFASKSSKKRGGKQVTSRKRSATKATSPKQPKATGNKRKRLTPGLRDRLYQQYKKDLLKEISPAKPPLNSSVTDILEKCQYQRKTKSVADEDDSDSSGDEHLVDPEKLDLGATFFSKQESAGKPPGKADEPPQFDVNAGMRLSDSSAEEGEGDQTIGEESLPASIPKRAADRLISHLNQQSSEYMNFTNLDQFTAKVEEAKRLLKSYQQREQQPPPTGNNGSADDVVASSPTKVPEENVSNLLAMGEKEREAVTVKQREGPESSDSEWEEVQTGDGTVGREEETSKPVTESSGWQVTIEMETAQSKRKRREEIEMELYIKREINRVKRRNQLNYHKASVLGAICIGQRLNRIIESGPLRGLLMSIMQSKCGDESKVKWDDKKMKSFAAWYKEQFVLDSNDFLVKRNGYSLSFVLSLAVYRRKVSCRHDYVLLFLACLRMAGVQARLVLSANVPPKRPAMSDLCPMSERQIKEKFEKRLSNGHAASKEVVPDKAPVKTVQKESKTVPKEIPPLLTESKEDKEKQSPISPAATKENPDPSPRRTRRQGNNTNALKPAEQPKVTTRRKALSTLNIPQLDGGDDRIVTTEDNLPVTRSLRSRSVPKVPTQSPVVGSSPFAKRQSNTPNSATTKPPSNATRKRKLFATQSEVRPKSPPITRTLSARKAAKKTPILQKETKEPKVKRRAIRPATSSGGDDDDDDDDAFESKNKSKSNSSATENDVASKTNSKQAKKVPKILLIDVVKSPEAANKLSSVCSPEAQQSSSDVIPKASAAKQSRRRAAARKKSSHASDDDDSDFEIRKEMTKVPRKRTSSATTTAKAKKSPRATNSKSTGEREKQQKTDLWIEFYSEKLKRWLTFDLASEQIDCVDLIMRNASSPISYVFAWDNAGHLKDVTARYVKNWNTACRMLRVEQTWLDGALRRFAYEKSEADLLEEKELNKLDADKPLPKTISELKNHPLYALRRHLLKYEALYPAEPPTLGFIRGEAIYPRECVHTLQTREKWYKQGRVVRAFETAYKVVKCWKYDRPTNNWLKDQPCDIFGYWQTDEYDPPTAENGLVPRNEYGNVELFTDKMLPKGTVHLKLPGLNKVCKRLQIDCAPALTGFDMAKMRVVPVYDGFVVCKEYAEQVVEEWYKEMEKEEEREQEKLEKRVYGNWKRLIKGLLVRRKLQNKYNFDNLAL